MIGPGRAFNVSDRYASSARASWAAATARPDPPRSIRRPDAPMAPSSRRGGCRWWRVQKALLDELGVTGLHAVAGGSMGGMQALQWVASYPAFVRSVVAIATTPRHSPQQIAFNEIARRAVMADPRWCGGDYDPSAPPADGLAVARMIGHVTYLFDRGMQQKFGRRRRQGEPSAPFAPTRGPALSRPPGTRLR